MNWCCTSCAVTACWRGSGFAGKDSPAESSMQTSNRGKSTLPFSMTVSNVEIWEEWPYLPLSLVTGTRCLMPVPSPRDSSLIARKLLRSFLGQSMWTTPSTNLVTPRYQLSSTQSLYLCFVLPDSDALQCSLFSGVLQSWAAGTPGGDEG